MSIIVLTPPPKTNAATVNTDESLGARMASEFLHMVGLEGRRFDSFEQLRDFAQAQIDAASFAAKLEGAGSAPVEADARVEAAAATTVVGDATNAVTGQAPAVPVAEPESIITLTPPPVQP